MQYIPKKRTNTKIMGSVTETQYSMLKALRLRFNLSPSRFWKVMEIGGLKGTSHSLILSKLVKKEYVIETSISPKRKAYKISNKGIDLLSQIEYLQSV